MSQTDSVIQSRPLDVRISSLYLERELYDNYPPFQRDKVWSEKMKRSLIDSILRGFYIPAVLVFSQSDSGGQKYWVIDGQQRLNAIFEFMEDKFKTSRSDRKDEPRYTPVESNKFYSQLSQEAKDRLRAYPLHFLILESVEEQMLGVMFRRLQNQVTLTGSEKLWSYTSEATRQAVQLSGHHFFSKMWEGRKNRKEPFQASLYCIFIEVFNGTVNLTTPRMIDLASGSKDSYIIPTFMQSLDHRLDCIRHLFHGTIVSNMTEMIPLYQSVLFLEEAGYDLLESKKGCLSSWYRTVQVENRDGRIKGFINLFAQMTKVNFQRQFWLKNLPVVAGISELYASDKIQSFNRIDRTVAWIRQGGICLECKKTVKLADIDHHIVRQSDKYNKSLETCASSVKSIPLSESPRTLVASKV